MARHSIKSANRFFLAPLVIILSLSPLFFASERPFFWSFWAAVSLLLLIIYLIVLAGEKVPLAPTDKALKIVMLLTAVFLGAILLQIIPLGKLIGGLAFETSADSEIVSSSLSLTSGDSFLGFLRWVSYAIFFFITLQITFRNEARARVLLRAVIVIVSLYAVYAMLALNQFGDTILTLEKWAYQGYATGPFVNRNSFATFLGLGAVVCLSFLLEVKEEDGPKSNVIISVNRWTSGRKPFLLTCLLLILITLFMTASRMGLFATALGLFTVMFFSVSRRLFVLSVLVSIFGISAYLMLSSSNGAFFDRLLTLEHSSETRWELYINAIEMIMARPLFGFGMGSFEYAFPLYHNSEVSPFLVWGLAHSTYLANWVEMGVIIGTIPILIFAVFAHNYFKSIFNGYMKVEVLSAAGCMIVIAIHSIVDFSMEIHAVAIYMVFILAIGYSGVIRSRAAVK